MTPNPNRVMPKTLGAASLFDAQNLEDRTQTNPLGLIPMEGVGERRDFFLVAPLTMAIKVMSQDGGAASPGSKLHSQIISLPPRSPVVCLMFEKVNYNVV